METISFESHGTRCEAWYLTAESDALTTAAGRPCVVMAHGFGGTRDSGLLPFAQRFAEAGTDVLVFDYRGFGTSDGEPRQDVNPWRHREDYHAAIAAARDREGVDPDRVVLWGTSYSGGHVVAVAAVDRRLAGIISQGAAMDGLAALANARSQAGTRATLHLASAGVRDLLRLGRSPVMVPIHGPVGSDAVLCAPGADAGYSAITGPTFRNEMLARGSLWIGLNRPVTSAGQVRCPALLVVAEHDDVAPPSAVHAVAQRMGSRAEVLSLECGHFEVYLGAWFEKSVSVQADFLQRILAP